MRKPPRHPDEPTGLVHIPLPPRNRRVAPDGALPCQIGLFGREVLDGQLVPPRSPSADPHAVFLASCSPSSKSTMAARLQAAVNILAPGVPAERFPWAALDHVAVAHVLDRMAESGAAPSTRNLTRAALRKMAKVLFGLHLMGIDERQRIDDVDPASGKREAAGRALTEAELRKLFRVCQRDADSETKPELRTAGARDLALCAVLYGAGLRRDEASRLDLADFRPGAGELRVVGKGDKEATQPIGPEVVAAVEAWIRLRGVVKGRSAAALFLVIDKFGRVLPRRLAGAAIAWKLRRRAAQAGIEPVLRGRRRHLLSPHDLRRSFGTFLLERGEDIGTVAKAMRHANISTTSIYDRRDRSVVAAAIAKLRVPLGR